MRMVPGHDGRGGRGDGGRGCGGGDGGEDGGGGGRVAVSEAGAGAAPPRGVAATAVVSDLLVLFRVPLCIRAL